MKKILIATLIAASLSGCASVPMGDPKQDEALKTFPAPTDHQAGVYIYRNESFGRAVKMDVAIDGKDIGQTAADTFLYKQVAPGKHTVTSKAENTDSIEIDAKPGMLYYIWQEVKIGLWSARTKLHLVNETKGKEGVQDCDLAATK